MESKKKENCVENSDIAVSSEKPAKLIHENIRNIQYKLRSKILGLHMDANAGHIGSSLSCIDILISVLILKKNNTDTFILSKGHAASALYVCLNYLGEISEEQLKTFLRNGTALPAHPVPRKFKGIPFGTGSLGHGFPIASGIAKAKKLADEPGFVYALMSDGETNAGTTWEAAHFSERHKLDNLILFIDHNGLQGFGKLSDVLGNTDEKQKWEMLGFDVIVADGHNLSTLLACINIMQNMNNGKPKVVIANTIKGKGVSYMENKLEWHYLPMTIVQYKEAKIELMTNYKTNALIPR